MKHDTGEITGAPQGDGKRKIAIYVVPTSDFHESEYVGEHFKARRFITGFTGSAGTCVITMTEAGLWTDGRYFVQAEKQLSGSTVTLYRMGEEGVPKVDEFIEEKLTEGGCIGFDGRVVNGSWGRKSAQIAEKKHGSLAVDEDFDRFDLEGSSAALQKAAVPFGGEIYRKEHGEKAE